MEHRWSAASYFAINFFLYNNTTQQRTTASLLRPQTNKYYNCMYVPCVWNTGLFLLFFIYLFFNYFCFWSEKQKEYGG